MSIPFSMTGTLWLFWTNLFLHSDQRDIRFIDVYAKYEAEFEHLPYSHDIGNGLVRDPYLLGADDESICDSVYGNSDASA